MKKRHLLHSIFSHITDRTKLMDNLLYVSLILMLGSSISGMIYMTFSSAFQEGPKVSISQLISGASLLVSQVVGLSGLIFWSITKDIDGNSR